MDPQIEKERLLNDVPIEQHVLDEAQKVMISARRKLGLGPSVITSIVVGLCHFVWTRSIDTFAVKLTGDGNPMLMANPDFAIKIGPEQSVFALVHEAYHLLLVHLYVDPELMKNQNWVTATEACINYRITKHLKLPLIQLDGKVAIVDPNKVYDRYRDGMKKAGLQPVSKEDFYATDIGCLSHLEMCPKVIKPRNLSSCVHASDNAETSTAGSGADQQAPIDPSEAQKFMDQVVGGAVQAAKNGRPGAKEEILGWMDASPEASQMWGDVGANTLRGETTTSRKSDAWERWTAEAMATKLAEGARLKYNKKLPWDPRVSPNGREPRRHGAVFVDSSGSMPKQVLDRIAALIGDLDNIVVEWHWFDAAVGPFKAGEPLRGGGGTSFQVIDTHLQEGGEHEDGEECCQDDQDFVLVITDGYAPEIIPADPDRWIWLITPGGSNWPLDAGMSCRELDLDAEES